MSEAAALTAERPRPLGRPAATEAASYYFTYIDKVPGDDAVAVLKTQLDETLAFLRGISDERSRHRYAPGKWSLREALNHVNDTERVFVFRAVWFARGFPEPLPSFDQDVAVVGAKADESPWERLVDEFESVRRATLTFFRDLPEEAWMKVGTASGNPFTVRALAFITAGHVTHHVGILKERYL